MKTYIAITQLSLLLCSMGIWLFLLYEILSALNPDRLVWVIYWAYIPVSTGLALFSKLIEVTDNE